MGYKGIFGLIIVFLLSASLVNADVVIKGKRTIYTGNALQSGITITESEIAPENPNIGDIWRDITDGTVYIWDGSWVVKNATPDIKDEIQVFKNNIGSVSDPATKKCLKALGKILLKLYKEELQ